MNGGKGIDRSMYGPIYPLPCPDMTLKLTKNKYFQKSPFVKNLLTHTKWYIITLKRTVKYWIVLYQTMCTVLSVLLYVYSTIRHLQH